MKKVVGTNIDGRVEWHARPISSNDYHTMCGVDAYDPDIGHHGTVEPPKGQKITCLQCRAMWEGFRALGLRDSDFARESGGAA